MHGVDQHQTFLHLALCQACANLFGNVYKCAAGGSVKPEFFTEMFHGYAFYVRYVGRVKRIAILNAQIGSARSNGKTCLLLDQFCAGTDQALRIKLACY